MRFVKFRYFYDALVVRLTFKKNDFVINAPFCHGFRWIAAAKNAYNADQSKTELHRTTKKWR